MHYQTTNTDSVQIVKINITYHEAMEEDDVSTSRRDILTRWDSWNNKTVKIIKI